MVVEFVEELGANVRLWAANVRSDVSGPTGRRLWWCVISNRGEAARKAFETFAIYITPFVIIGAAVSFLMKRYAVDLSDVEKQAGPKPRRRISLGSLAH